MKIGFIGCGNMATAIIRGILREQKATPGELMASARTPKTRQRIREQLQISCGSNREVAAWADLLFLAVKPKFYEEVIAQIKDQVPEGALIASIAPGKDLAWLDERFGGGKKILRLMPNTPALVGEGMTGICACERVSEAELALVEDLCRAFGRCERVAEHLMDVVTAVSGSSPAYVFMIIEAMADAAVAEGMPRKEAYTFAAQALYGSAKMVLETGLHPGVLKDQVCSPGGTTIQAVRVLEEKGLRSALMEAVCACTAKSRGM